MLLLAPPQSAKLDGLYRAFPGVAQYGASTGETYLFTAKGEIHSGWIGTANPKTFDFARARKSAPARTGRYTIAGETMTFRWADGKTESAPFSRRGAALAIGPDFAYRILPHGGPLSGTFAPATYQGGYDPTPGTPDLLNPIVFTPAGTFSTDGAKGRYAAKAGTLVLTPASGAKRIHALHVFANRPNPPTTLLIDGRPFNAEKK